MGQIISLKLEPVTEEGFAEFGELLGYKFDGSFFDVKVVDLVMSFSIRPYGPFSFEVMEKHTLRQGFVSIDTVPWIVPVAKSKNDGLPDLEDMRAFLIQGGKGVIIEKNIWHTHSKFPLSTAGCTILGFLDRALDKRPELTQRINTREKLGVTCKIEL